MPAMAAERSRETVIALRATRAAVRLAQDVALSQIRDLTTDRCRSCGQWFSPAGTGLRERTLCSACRVVRPLVSSHAVLMAWFVEIYAAELGIPLAPVRLAAFRESLLETRLWPDTCYYVANAAAAAGVGAVYDAAAHPPPDLVLEGAVTTVLPSLEPACAALGVPELWRFDGRHLEVLALTPEQEYAPSEESLAFPSLPLPDLRELLTQLHGVGDAARQHAYWQWAQALNFA